MNPILLALLTMLGLKEDATEATATAALTTLQDQVAAKDTEIAALKTRSPDPAKFVPIETVQQLQQDIAALKATDLARGVDVLVQDALDSGRLLPAMEEWARDLGKTNLAALKSYIEKATPIAALVGTQTGGRKPAGGETGAIGESDLAVCKQLGINVEDYQKANGQQAA